MTSQLVHWSARGPSHAPPHVEWHGWQLPDGLAIWLLGHTPTQRPSAGTRSGVAERGLHEVHAPLAALHVEHSAGQPSWYEQLQSPPAHPSGVAHPSAQTQPPS